MVPMMLESYEFKSIIIIGLVQVHNSCMHPWTMTNAYPILNFIDLRLKGVYKVWYENTNNMNVILTSFLFLFLAQIENSIAERTQKQPRRDSHILNNNLVFEHSYLKTLPPLLYRKWKMYVFLCERNLESLRLIVKVSFFLLHTHLYL